MICEGQNRRLRHVSYCEFTVVTAKRSSKLQAAGMYSCGATVSPIKGHDL
jgi:hypothetical protein